MLRGEPYDIPMLLMVEVGDSCISTDFDMNRCRK